MVYGTLAALNVIACWVTWTVTGLEPAPCTLATLLNQRKSPAGMAVPLRLEVIEDRVEGVQRCSNSSIPSSHWRRAGLAARPRTVPLGRTRERTDSKSCHMRCLSPARYFRSKPWRQSLGCDYPTVKVAFIEFVLPPFE